MDHYGQAARLDSVKQDLCPALIEANMKGRKEVVSAEETEVSLDRVTEADRGRKAATSYCQVEVVVPGRYGAANAVAPAWRKQIQVDSENCCNLCIKHGSVGARVDQGNCVEEDSAVLDADRNVRAKRVAGHQLTVRLSTAVLDSNHQK